MLDLASKIPSLSKVPVKIIWGLKDPCFHREMLNNVAAHFPQASVVEIPEASHLVLEDAPEIVIEESKSFLLGEDIARDETILDKDSKASNQNILYQSFFTACK